MPAPEREEADPGLRLVVGLAAIVFPAVHVVADVMELVAGHLFSVQLVATYVAEAAVPFLVLGLNAVQQPRGGWLSRAGAVLYGAAFVGWSATALYALVTGIEELDLVLDDLGAIYGVNAALMLAGGLLFAASVLRARVLPAWTGLVLAVGLLASTLIAAAGLPPGAQALGTAIRSAALVGMGLACLWQPVAARTR